MTPALACVLLVASIQSGDDPEGPEEEAAAQIEGDVSLGYRFLRLDGSRAQYEEDVNLEEGLFLRSARVRASGLDHGPLESVELEAENIGDPWSSLRLEALGGPWRTRADLQRTRYVGNAQADQHRFDVERERMSLGVDYRPPESETRSSVGFDLMKREGLYVGSRSVNRDFVEGFPVRRKETTRAVSADFGSRAGSWSLDLGLGLDTLDADDARTFTLPAPDIPGEEVSEDFSSEIRGLGQQGNVRLARELAEETSVSLAMGWHSSTLDGDENSVEEGFFSEPSLPFLRTTTGELEFDENELESRLELSHSLSELTQVAFGYELHHESGEGDLAELIILDEFMGDPPSVFPVQAEAEHESTLHLLTVEASTELSGAHLDLALEWGREEAEVRQVGDGVVVRRFDGSLREFGGEARLSLELEEKVSLELGLGHHLRPTETPEAGVAFDFEDDRETFARGLPSPG